MLLTSVVKCVVAFHFTAKEIVDAINACSSLKALRLEGNTLGIEAAKEIAEALKKRPEFEVS